MRIFEYLTYYYYYLFHVLTWLTGSFFFLALVPILESVSLRSEGLALEFSRVRETEDKTDAYFICNFFVFS